jgi:hypothetical protein
VHGTHREITERSVAIIKLKHSLILGCIIAILLLTAGCTDNSRHPGAAAPSSSQPAIGSNSPFDHVEVYHFHGNNQCSSCIAVGDLAEKTVNANFKDELASGRLVFAHINAELPENRALAEKYGVTGSSLWIGVYNGNGFHKEQDAKVWYLIDNEDAYTSYLSEIITKRLNGNLT